MSTKIEDAQAHSTLAAGSVSSREYREAIESFGKEMLSKLEENCHKGRRIAWQNWIPASMMERLDDEIKELGEAVYKGDAKATMREAADVANFAMMVWDFYACRQLPPNTEVRNAGPDGSIKPKAGTGVS